MLKTYGANGPRAALFSGITLFTRHYLRNLVISLGHSGSSLQGWERHNVNTMN
jgi:hypothetical protein